MIVWSGVLLMAYGFHITRGEFWAEDPAPVTFDEAVQAIRDLPDFSVDPEGKVQTVNPRSGQTLTMMLGKCIVYRDTVRIAFNAGAPAFAVRDTAELPPFLELAERLGAQVQGDEGEVYTKDDI